MPFNINLKFLKFQQQQRSNGDLKQKHRSRVQGRATHAHASALCLPRAVTVRKSASVNLGSITRTAERNISGHSTVGGHGGKDFEGLDVDPVVPFKDQYQITELLLQASALREDDGDIQAPPSTPLDYDHAHEHSSPNSTRLPSDSYGDEGHNLNAGRRDYYDYHIHGIQEIREAIMEGVTYDAILVSNLNSKLKTSTSSAAAGLSENENEMLVGVGHLGKRVDGSLGDYQWDVGVPPNSPASTLPRSSSSTSRSTLIRARSRRGSESQGHIYVGGKGERGYRSLVGVSIAIMESRLKEGA